MRDCVSVHSGELLRASDVVYIFEIGTFAITLLTPKIIMARLSGLPYILEQTTKLFYNYNCEHDHTR